MHKKYNLVLLVIVLSNIIIPLSVSATMEVSGGDFTDGIAVDHEFSMFDVQTYYKSSDDFSSGWRITGNKAIDMELRVIDNSDNYTILIEHMHCDIFIESRREAYDDLTQDSMDDNFHGLQGGFYINESRSYYETFSIEGSHPDFQYNVKYIWDSYYLDYFGADFEFSEEFLTENGEMFGQTLYVVYDVIYKTQNDDYFSKVIVTDNIFVDINGTVLNNEGNYIDEQNEATEGEPFNLWWLALIIPCIVIIGYCWWRNN